MCLISHRYPTEIQEFDKLCKKDDVADAFNQGIVWILMNLRKNEEMKRLWDDLDIDTLRGQFLEEKKKKETKEKEDNEKEEEDNKEDIEGSEKEELETKETYWKKLRERIYNEDD